MLLGPGLISLACGLWYNCSLLEFYDRWMPLRRRYINGVLTQLFGKQMPSFWQRISSTAVLGVRLLVGYAQGQRQLPACVLDCLSAGKHMNVTGETKVDAPPMYLGSSGAAQLAARCLNDVLMLLKGTSSECNVTPNSITFRTPNSICFYYYPLVLQDLNGRVEIGRPGEGSNLSIR